MRLGRRKEALSQLAAVVRLNPADGEAWLYHGDLLLALRRDEAGARKSWRRALRNAPPGAPWAMLARRRLAAGLSDEASPDAAASPVTSSHLHRRE